MADDWLMGALAAQDAYRGDEPAWPEAPEQYGPPTQWQMGQLAAQRGTIDPGTARGQMGSLAAMGRAGDVAGPVLGGIAHGVVDELKTPGAMFAQNPYDRGTEEWQSFEDSKYKMAAPWARGMSLNFIGTGLPFAVKGGLGMAGGRPVDPRLWSPISETKLRKPLSEMEHQYTDVRYPAPKFVDPKDLVGGHLVLTPSDLSAANRTVTHIDATKLDRPVVAHGGVGFPEANQMAWASEAPIARRLDNQAARLAETGKPVYIAPMTMAPTGIDASHHVADPLAQLVQQAPIKVKDAKAFDKVMRAEVPDWVSIRDKDFPDYIRDLQGGMTTKALMANRMALAGWQERGFPDVAAVRHAMSEPTLIEAPRNTVGMAISQYIPGKGLLDTAHPSYSKGVAGQYMGQLASLVPFADAAPSIAKGLAEVNARNIAAGKKVAIQPAYHLGRPTEGVPTSQYLDQEWLDNIMRRFEADRR